METKNRLYMEKLFTLKTKVLFGVFMLLYVYMSGVSYALDMRISHQWPDNNNDLRHEMLKLIVNEFNKNSSGVSFKIYPNASLFKPKEQWSAMASGVLDMSAFPLAYAAPSHREFSLTLMPGMVKNHDHAKRFNQSRAMLEIKKIINKAGVVVLADTWLSGGIVSSKNCILAPGDAKGLWLRSAGIAYDQMLKAAGARLNSMPSSQIYEKLGGGRLDGALTSSASLISFRVYEKAKCLTAPSEHSLWFMYEPILMSKSSFDRLNKQQQTALLAAAKKAEQFAEQEARKVDSALLDIYKSHGVKIVKMDNHQLKKWLQIAEDSSYEVFVNEVKEGKKLLKWAQSVK